ncbi:hypothetical protein LCGC14_2548340, partial [marine sediment metagenome]
SITFKNCDAPGQDVQVNFRGTTVDPITGFRFVSGWPEDVVCKTCGGSIAADGTLNPPTSIPLGSTASENFVSNRYGAPVNVVNIGQKGGGVNADCLNLCLESISWLGYPFEAKLEECLRICENQPGDGGPTGSEGGIPAGDGQDGLDPCESISAMNVQEEIALDCKEASPALKLRVCGGNPPYTWSVEDGEGLEAVNSGGWDQVVTVKPSPSVNNFPGIEAYREGSKSTAAGLPHKCNGDGGSGKAEKFGCDGGSTGCTNPGTDGVGCSGAEVIYCCDGTGADCSDPGKPLCNEMSICNDGACGGGTGPFGINDNRTQAMKDDGCRPCSLQKDGASVSVVDQEGVIVTTVL